MKLRGISIIRSSRPEVFLAQVFSCEFCEILKNIFFTEHLRATTSVLFRNAYQTIIFKNTLKPVTTAVEIRNLMVVFKEKKKLYTSQG